MKQKKKAPSWRRRYDPSKIIIFGLAALVVIGGIMLMTLGGDGEQESESTAPTETVAVVQEEKKGFFALVSDFFSSIKGVKETEEQTLGVDVAKYQGTIDWQQVAESGIDFAFIRVGYRTQVDGVITADTNAKYNMQEASKYGIKLGAYFFSTAVTAEEAKEEAQWVADFIAQYPITYPVAYNCEGFSDPENRQYAMSVEERTDIALVFLETIEELGYEAMFYASKNEMEADVKWEVSRIEPDYKVWVAQYPEQPYPITAESTYSGAHQMWQYTRNGTVPGISQPADMNIAYFGYDGTRKPKDDTVPETAKPDPEALMPFDEVDESVTAKELTNLRDIPSQDTDSVVLCQLQNGEVARRIGVSDSGWSKLEYNGQICYAVSNLLTTDLGYSPDAPTEDDGIETEFQTVNEKVTAKELVNLRNIPSVDDPESKVVAQLKNGEIATRTGINTDVGWSRVEYNGQTLYCVSSLLKEAE